MEGSSSDDRAASKRWINRSVVGIVLATFFSDVSHEMCTAVLPLYLTAIGLGPAALGAVEGIGDLVRSLSKLGGGVLGHYVKRKRPWAALGYVVTSVATAGIGLVRQLPALVTLRSAAWCARGFRSPLRDYLLADAVEKTHYGRAFGLERAGDMLGAVSGPLLATLLLWVGWSFRTIILWTLLPGLAAAALMFFLIREREDESSEADGSSKAERPAALKRFPAWFWLFLVGVFLFGLGDFSRTFLVWLVAQAVGDSPSAAVGTLSVAALLYAVHNLVSAGAAYPVGWLGDRRAKFPVLVVGYAVGVGTNVLLALRSGSLVWLAVAIVLSGVYIAVEETLEKAVAAELLPRDLRSLGFGILACTNAVGDMASSLYVGFLLQARSPAWAFGIAAAVGAVGVVWMLALLTLGRPRVEGGVAEG